MKIFIFIILILCFMIGCASMGMNHSPKLLKIDEKSVSIGVNAGAQFDTNQQYSYDKGISFEGVLMGRYGMLEWLDIGLKIYGGNLTYSRYSQFGILFDTKFKLIDLSGNTNCFPFLLTFDAELTCAFYKSYDNPPSQIWTIKPSLLFGAEYIYTGIRCWWIIPYQIVPNIIIGSSIFDNPKIIIEGNIFIPSIYLNDIGASVGICVEIKI